MDISFEELRLQHYNICHEETKPYLTATSKLMATRQLSAPDTKYHFRPIRAAAERTHKYAVAEEHL